MSERKTATNSASKAQSDSAPSRRKGAVGTSQPRSSRATAASSDSQVLSSVEIEAKPPPTVEGYLAQLVSPQREMFDKLRRIVRDAAPKAIERIKAGHPIFEHQGPLCAISAHASCVSIEFYAVSCMLSDPDHLLKGTGESRREVKIRAMSEIRAGQLSAWVRKAVEFNEDA